MVDPIKVVIIDDEPETLRMLEAFLKLLKFEVVGKLTGTEGRQAIAEHNPDVLVLDLMLPDMDGLELCREVRRQTETANLPVVILSARTTRDDERRGYEAGANIYLKKPVDLDHLAEAIRRVAGSVER